MQAYMKPNRVLSYQDQIKIFSYRAEMNELKINFKGLKEEEFCICTHIMNNHLYECKSLNSDDNSKYQYEDLLNGTFHQQKKILNILKKNLEYYRKIVLATRADS